MARRLAGIGIQGYRLVLDKTGRWNNRSYLVEDRLSEPDKLKPCRIFVTSMGDIFNPPAVSMLDPVFDTIQRCREHTFILLTKRPVVGEEYFNRPNRNWEKYRNVWIGVTVEDQCQIHRAYTMRELPGRVHFLSCEPLLGPIDLSGCIADLDWVICGCETGTGARSADPAWVRSLRDQCAVAGVPFFLKGLTGVKTKKGALPTLDGKIWGEFPK